MADPAPSTSTSTPRPQQLAGGFLPPPARSQTLPSPAPSTASSRAAARLPAPRSRPLVPGSRKEEYARDYVAQKLLHVSRRFVKKHANPGPDENNSGGSSSSKTASGGGENEEEEEKAEKGKGKRKGKEGEKEVPGYESVDQMCADLEEVVDVLWFSGTPSLQIPYLINVASALTTYLGSFPPSPRPTFSLLQKLDHCFASLLVGRDVKTRDPLPGFQGGSISLKGLSRTDMVRVKSIADETRILVAVVMSGEAEVEDNADDDGDGDGYGYGDDDDDGPAGLRRPRGRAKNKGEDRILDPFEAQIDPGEGIIYRLKPEGDYGGFVADEDTDDEDEDELGAILNVKKEEDVVEGDGDEENDGDEDEFVDVAQPKIIPKRKVDDDLDLIEEEAEESDPIKRIRVKEEEEEEERKATQVGSGDSGDSRKDTAEAFIKVEEEEEDEEENEDTPLPEQQTNVRNNSRNSGSPPRRPTTADNDDDDDEVTRSNGHNIPAAGNGTQQFHFALDDDEDEDEDDSEGETLPNKPNIGTGTIPSSNGTHHHQQQHHHHHPRNEEGDDYDDEITDEEEEELHMNVAKVYEKTLVQLGKSLGESIGDDT